MGYDGYSKDTVTLARLTAAAAKAKRERAEREQQAERLWAVETNDRAVRAMEGATRDLYSFGDLGDDYEDAQEGS